MELMNHALLKNDSLPSHCLGAMKKYQARFKEKAVVKCVKALACTGRPMLTIRGKKRLTTSLLRLIPWETKTARSSSLKSSLKDDFRVHDGLISREDFIKGYCNWQMHMAKLINQSKQEVLAEETGVY